ncbi:MAG: AMP-binding protein [Thermodesulfobacteriota bacterium]
MAGIPPECQPPVEYLPDTIWTLPELQYPDRMNLAEIFLDRNVAQRPDKVAVYFNEDRITYRELRARVNRFANALRELGVGKYDRVLLRSPNIPEYLIWNFACWRIGAIPVLVNHLNRHEEVAFKSNDTEAVAVCVQADFYEDVAKARPACPHLKHVIIQGRHIPGTLNHEDLVRDQADEAETEDTSRDDIGRLIYSSGTTGRPKGIITTLAGLLSATDTHARYILKVQEDDVLGGHPYFTFAFGSVNFTLYPWRFGASVSVISRFRPEEQFRLVQEHGITKLFAVPTAFRMMLGVKDAEKNYDCRSLRLGQSAGEWLPGATALEWKRRFGVPLLDSLGSGDLMYWLSTFEGMDERKYGSTGFSVPGFENKIVDENFNEVPPGAVGELIVRGPVGQTYWRRPDKQKEGVCPPDSKFKGWSRPGIVFLKDEEGYFWYKSRSDDMIVTAGYKIPGGEVEGALNNHPAVLESAVVDTPDPERGNVIKAFVVLKEGFPPSEEMKVELQEFVKKEIEPYKYPRLIEFAAAGDLPRTSTGKIQRNVLRARERSGAA